MVLNAEVADIWDHVEVLKSAEMAFGDVAGDPVAGRAKGQGARRPGRRCRRDPHGHDPRGRNP